MKKVSIIGLGYVGLPLACLAAKKGHAVFGIDLSKEIVEKTNKGESHILDEGLKKSVFEAKGKIHATTNASEVLKDSEVIVVCVPTPVDKKCLPDLGPVKAACEDIAKSLKKGQVVIVESTIYPGTIQEVVHPILEKSGLKAGKDFYLAHCPERIDPGNKKWAVEKIPRVVGGINEKSTQLAAEFYESILDAKVKRLNSVKAAEAVKIMENTFRDINIAFVNEMARSFDVLGIDIKEVIEGASSKPFGFMPFYPGPGVGGHCIAVDPYYLIERARQSGFDHKFLRLAREINESMPSYVIQLASEGLNHSGKSLNGSKVCVLGIAYKPNVDDSRESPSFPIIELLQERKAVLKIFDPLAVELNNSKSIEDAVKDSDCVIIATNHEEFLEKITPEFLKKNKVPFILDCRNSFKKQDFEKAGILYKGVGS
ncbi:MAG: nucleotide sugar dehydrogenase [Candidatus Diapherotrites archaeon]|nr:nucleotide sugar dehydrogenase [Candidatus Diapherotrites archaeon]